MMEDSERSGLYGYWEMERGFGGGFTKVSGVFEGMKDEGKWDWWV